MGKVTDYDGADIHRYNFHGLVRSGYPPFLEHVTSFLNMSRSRVDFFGCVREPSGADIRLRRNSRIVTERISADANNFYGLLRSGYPSHVFFHGAVYLTPSSKPYTTAAFISPRCTEAIIR